MKRRVFPSLFALAMMLVASGAYAQSWQDAVIASKQEVASALSKAQMPVSTEAMRRGGAIKKMVINVEGLDKLVVRTETANGAATGGKVLFVNGVAKASDGTSETLERLSIDYNVGPAPVRFTKETPRPMKVAGVAYPSGMVFSPTSEVAIKLDKKYKTIELELGASDFTPEKAAIVVKFQNVASSDVVASLLKTFPVEVGNFIAISDVYTPNWINSTDASVEKAAAEKMVASLSKPEVFAARIKAVSGNDLNAVKEYLTIFDDAKAVYLVQSKFQWLKVANVKSAVEDMKTIKGFDASTVEPKLKELEQLMASNINIYSGNADALANATKALELSRQILMSNPCLDVDKLVLSRYNVGPRAREVMAPELGTQPNNWSNQTSSSRRGYDGEIITMTSLRSTPKESILFKPVDKVPVTDLRLHWDADRMLFTSLNERGLWGVFETDMNGNAKEVVRTDDEDLEFFDGTYLPNKKVIANSNIGYQGVPCVDGEDAVGNMVLYNPADKNLRRMTFDQDANWNPIVMNNGKLMYVRWEYTDLTHYFSRFVMHMNPDGSEAKALYGSGSFFPNSIFDVQPLPGSGSKFVGIVSGHHGIARSGRLMIFDPAKSRKEEKGIIQEIPFRNRPIIPLIKDELVNGVWPQFIKPFPLNENYYLVAGKLDENALWGIYLVDVFDNVTLIAEYEGEGLIAPILVEKRAVPPVIPDRIDLTKKDATVFIQDIYEGEGLPGVPRGEIKKLRVFAYEYAYIKSPSNHYAQGIQSGWDIKRLLGEVPVEEDGSVNFTIPANTPVSLQPLDKDGAAVQWMRSWFTGMPGETVSCVGCHEDQNQIAMPKNSIARSKAPTAIEAPEGGVRPYTFELEIQPILDRACVACHNEKSNLNFTKGRIDQIGFSESYLAFHPYVRRQGPEADIYVMKPYEYHASTSEVVNMLKTGHHNVKLTDKEWRSLYAWIDMNAPYHSSFRQNDLEGRDQIKRRMELSKKYNNMQVDWQKEIDDYTEYLKSKGEIAPVLPEPLEVKEPKAIKLKGWPLTSDAAVAAQNALGETTKTIEIAPGIKMVFKHIPAGQFIMGSSRDLVSAPESKVKIDKAFWIGELEVSNEQFCALVPEHDSRYIAQMWKDHTGPGYPANLPKQSVTRVSYEDAMAYCKLLSEKTGLKMTLPTEAQWEWACRAGSAGDFWYGNLNTDFGQFANLADVQLEKMAVSGIDPQPMSKKSFWYKYCDFLPKISAVDDGVMLLADGGKYKANPWGLYDMHGNVEEWTNSDYVSYPYNTKGVAEKGMKVVRGGSWYERPKDATSYTRRGYLPWQKVHNAGFRVVIED